MIALRNLSLAVLLILGGCRVAAPIVKPVIKPPPVAPPVVQPAFLGHLPLPGETLPVGRTNVYAGNMLIGYLVRDDSLYAAPHAARDTGIFWTVERDPSGLRHWRAAGDTAWVVSQAFGDGAPWRVAP